MKKIRERVALMALGIVFLLLAVGLSGCINVDTSNDRKDTDDWGNSDDPWNDNDWNEPDNDNDDIKIIKISGLGSVDTINYVEKPVKLIVSGMNCVITVSKSTDLHEVIISGMGSLVKVSKSHSFTSTITGMNAIIVYYD